ncbi:SpoIIE family protein phosphatase [Luedemannella helvata]|uniref:CHASE domain-containing protein n=1 Tax=Luedemannella helvata TaxID=349315 RepID=A0ABN2K0D4_9ACTN
MLLVGGTGVYAAVMAEDARAVQRDRQAATVAAAALSDSLARTTTALSGVGGIASDGTVTPAEFRHFAADVIGASALTTLAHVVIVRDGERDAFEARVGRPIIERNAEGRFVPAGRRAQYAVVLDVEPVNDTTRPVLGFDTYSDAVRSAAAYEAATTRRFVLSAPTRLAPSGRPGYFLTQPIFTRADSSGTLVGFVSTGLLAENLVDAAHRRLPAGTRVGVSDGSLVIADAPAGGATTTVTVAGRRWSVTADDPTPTDRTLPAVILVATLLLAVLLGILWVREGRFERTRAAFATRAAEESRRAERLAGVARGLAEARHLDAVVAVIEEHVPPLVGADSADIGLLLGDRHLSMLGTSTGDLDAQLVSRYRRVALNAHLPTTAAVRQRDMVFVDDLLAYQADEPEILSDVRASGFRSAAAVPLRDDTGAVFGVLSLLWREPREFDSGTAAVLRTVGEMCGQTLDRARDAEGRHEFVAALQRRLLPAPPGLRRLAIAARYRPATHAIGMGGDWYQFLPRADGSLVVVVGDVVGHGVEAVAAMTQMQHVISAAVHTGVPTEQIVGHLEAALGGADGSYGTAQLLQVDLARDRVGYVSAGHPYALLRTPDGTVSTLDGAQYGLLGGLRMDTPMAYARFPVGSTLLAYTDGLIERRDQAITDSIATLAADFAEVSCDDVEGCVDEIMRRAAADGAESAVNDDVAVVLLRRTG